MTITIPADLATVLRADADRLHVAPEALALDRLRLALAPRDAQGRFAEKGTRLRRKAKSERPNVNNGTLTGNGKASTQSKATGDAGRPIGKGDPGYYEGYDTPEERAALDADLRAADESLAAGRGIPGDVARTQQRQHLAERRAQHETANM